MTATLKASPDGTQAILQVGGVDKLTVDQSGNVAIAGKLAQAAQSMVRLHTANGYGTTNTAIRRFTTVVESQGADITYADSATLGASFTINTPGVYAISYTDSFSANSMYGISLNSNQLTAGIGTISVGDRLAYSFASVNATVTVSWTGYLTAGAVVRAHAQGVGSGSTPAVITVVRVA